MKKKLFRLIVLCGCMILWAVFFFLNLCVVIAPLGDNEWYLFVETAGFWLLQMGCIFGGRRFMKIVWPWFLCFAAYLLNALMCWEVLIGIWCGRLLDPPGLLGMCAVLNAVGAMVVLRTANQTRRKKKEYINS